MRIILPLLLTLSVVAQTTLNTNGQGGGSVSSSSYTFSTSQSSGSTGNIRSSSSSTSSTSSTLPPIRILLIVGVRNQIMLSPSLLNYEGIPVPLVGFNYNYSVNNLPQWASFSRNNNSIILNPPTNWANQVTLNVGYNDSKGYAQTLVINLSPAFAESEKTYDFIAFNANNRVQNYQTLAFPLFAGQVEAGGKISISNLLSTQAYVINVGRAPWTADIQIIRPGGVSQQSSSTVSTTINSQTQNSNSNQNFGNSNQNINVGFGGNNNGNNVGQSGSFQTTSFMSSSSPGTVIPTVYQFPIAGQTNSQQFTFVQRPQTNQSSQNTIVSIS